MELFLKKDQKAFTKKVFDLVKQKSLPFNIKNIDYNLIKTKKR